MILPIPKVFLTRELPSKAMELLKSNTNLEMNMEDRVLSKKEIITGVKGKDALLCLLTDTIDAEIMDANPNLKIISNFAVGYNNIDVQAATNRKIIVTNTPGVLTETSADMAFALMLSVGRRVAEADRYVRTGMWKGWGPIQFLGSDIHSTTLGIIGMGRIGKAVARRAKGFNMKVIYWNRTKLSNEEEISLDVQYRSFEEVLEMADFISLHVAYHPETYHLLNQSTFQKMKNTAFIINTSRGPVIDEKALVLALQSRKIAGAGLDVFENEPSIESELLKMENVVLVPHLASATIATRTKMGIMAVENLLAVFQGNEPKHQVNKI